MTKDSSTEEKIRAAAKEVFFTKGFDGCTSREIAKAAGMNVALVNYYFRSKSQLFQLVFRAAMEDFMLGMIDVFQTDQSLEDKIRIFIEKEYEFLSKHPEIPRFIIGEMTRFEGCSIDHMDILQRIDETGIFQACQVAQNEGKMRKMNLLSITMLMMSNCQFPFMARPLVQGIHKISDEVYERQLILHKQYVTEMIIGYLFPSKNS